MGLVDDLRAGPGNDVDRTRDLMGRSADCIEQLNGQIEEAQADIARLNAARGSTASARKDLIRRLVAVAISVGFASHIVSRHVLDHWTGELSLKAEIARLSTALLVILLGWDWYDRDVEDKPLTRISRFILDAIIVMAQLILLLASEMPSLWGQVLVAIFALYILWDILAIIDHPSAFGLPDPRPDWWLVPKDVALTYLDGFVGDDRKRGPPINLGWFIYFVMVLWVIPFPGEYSAFATCLLVALGALALWGEGVRRRDGGRLITLRVRLGILIGLALLYLIYWICWWTLGS
jgi:hypothetical protein